MAEKSNKVYVVNEWQLNDQNKYDLIYKTTRADLVYRKATNDKTVEDAIVDYETRGVKSDVRKNQDSYYTAFSEILANIDFASFEEGYFDRLTAQVVTAETIQGVGTISGTNGSINFATGTFNYGNKLIWDGTDLTVNGNGTFTGTVNASAGNIGGFTIGANSIASSNGAITLNSNGTGVFTGAIHASSGEFTGTVNASSGSIGGFTIGADSISSSNGAITLNSDGTGVFTGTVYASDGEFTGTVHATDGEFTGTVYATDGEFTGTINANDGTIGGFVIGSNSIASSNGAITLNSNGSGIFTGTVYASDGSFTGTVNASQGNIGGFIIGANSITSNDEGHAIRINSDGTFTFGSANNMVSYDGTTLTVTNGSFSALQADVANINQLLAGHAGIGTLQAINLTSDNVVIDSAVIRDMIAANMTVGDLAAGDITISNNMRIISENGNLVMNGSAMQIMGKIDNGDGTFTDYVGIQIGYDTSGQPSIIVRDENGASILTSSGITSDAIADGLIINDMIHTGTISKDRLGFSIVEANAQGGIDITQVYDGSGNQWGVQYNTFKQDTQAALDEIEAQKMYRVVIESDNGNIFKNGAVSCTLSCRVYSWDDDITDDINAVNFTWTRKSNDSSADAVWNANHSGGQKSITLTPADVFGRSVFYCTVVLPDGTTAVGE